MSKSTQRSREELAERVAELESEVERLQNLIHTVADKRKDTAQEVQDNAERLGDLRDDVDRIDARIEKNDGKESKIQQLLEHAQNLKDTDESLVKLKARDIKAATGCSRRYAYDLIDELPANREWILTHEDVPRRGSVEMDFDKMEKAIYVDCEGVHSPGPPVNLFTTGGTEEGVE